MFDESVTDASEAVIDMAVILGNVRDEYLTLAENLEKATDALQSREGKRLRTAIRTKRKLDEDLEDFSDGVEEVTHLMNGSHDKLIQTLGDVLLACDIDDRSQMLKFNSLMSTISNSLEAVEGLQKISATFDESLGGSGLVKRSHLRTTKLLSYELKRVASVFTRMIHLSEYFT